MYRLLNRANLFQINQQISKANLKLSARHAAIFSQSLPSPQKRNESPIGESEAKTRNGDHRSHQQADKSKISWKAGLSSVALFSSVFISYRNSSGGVIEPPDNNGINNLDGGNSQLFEELHHAVLVGDERRLRVLIKNCSTNDINSRHKLGWQLLHLAAVNGRAEICELLLNAGAKVNDIDNYSSPRQMSEQMRVDPLVIALIRDTEFNPDLARINFHGSTPLHYAAMSNSQETVEILTKYGANPCLKNDLGYKPCKLANQKIATYLDQYEKDYLKHEKELEEEERRKFPLEKRIKNVMVGQDAAISMVAATIRRKENGWFDEDHPLVFLFLGSSGIGKTEMAKQVAKYLHKDNKAGFIRLDMSEFQEKHSVARMIGSPPGYVGHQDGGQLTDALKKCDNAVVLFDEVEKAHPEVLTILLQLFDEGRLTDSKGHTIECKNAIFIMTSNLASEAIAQHALQLRSEQQLAREMQLENRLRNNHKHEDYQEQITISRKFKDTIVRPVLKTHFKRDEFLGRINEMVYFLPFSEAELRQLVVKELEFWAARAKKKNSIQMTWDPEVVDLISKGYDVHYGARSIKHEIERRIINQISELHHSVKNAKKVHISVAPQDKGSADLIRIKIN